MMKKTNILLAMLLFFVTISTRLPFKSKVLYCWDSVQFALATEKFDVSLYQPHPPGYILYVALAKVLNLLTSNPNLSLILINIIFSGLTVVCLFYLTQKVSFTSLLLPTQIALTRSMQSKKGLKPSTTSLPLPTLIAFSSASLFIFSPIFWFNGEVALPYVMESLFSLLIALVCYEIIWGKDYFVLSSILLGLAGGVRQNLILFLFPLWLYALILGARRQMSEVRGQRSEDRGQRTSVISHQSSVISEKREDTRAPEHKRTEAVIIKSLLVLALVCLLWYLPLTYLSGGIVKYQQLLKEQMNYVLTFSIFSKGLAGFFDNLKKVVASSIFTGLGATLFLPLFYLAGVGVRWREDRAQKREIVHSRWSIVHRRQKAVDSPQKTQEPWTMDYGPWTKKSQTTTFFLLWLLPSFLFYSFIFIDPPSYVLTFLPGLFILLGVAQVQVSLDLVRYFPGLPFLRIYGIILGLFILANVLVFYNFFPAKIKENNIDWQAKEICIKKNFLPEKTLLLTSLSRGSDQDPHTCRDDPTGRLYEGLTPSNYFRHGMYYLDRYRVYFLPRLSSLKTQKRAVYVLRRDYFPLTNEECHCEPKAKQSRLRVKNLPKFCFEVDIPKEIDTLVFLDNYLANYCRDDPTGRLYGGLTPIKKIKQTNGKSLYYLRIKGRRNLIYGYHHLWLK